MDLRIIDILKYARIPIELNTEPGEEVAIVADTHTDPLVWQALAAAAVAWGAEPSVMIMTPRPAHGYEPTTVVAEAMRRAQTTIDCTSRALAHSHIFREIQQKGRRWIAMHGVTVDMLSSGATLDDYVWMDKLGMRIEEAWTQSDEVRVTSEYGTEFRASVRGRKGISISGRVANRPDIGLNICAFPDGEVAIAPVEGTGNGVVVFDTTFDHVGLLTENIRMTIRDGRIANIEGGTQAQKLSDLLKLQNDDFVYNFPAEMSVGLNPKVTITGSMRTDKKLLGSMHMALGTNIDIGGTVKAKVHLDGLIRRPTVLMDGRLILEAGRVMI